MKKILLSLFLIGSVAFAKAQVLNEYQVAPGSCKQNDPKGGSEYFEIFGNQGATNLGCYALVTYFYIPGSGQTPAQEGFYVVELPEFTTTPNAQGQWWYVVGEKTFFCISGNKDGNANTSWNTLGVKKYLWNGAAYTVTTQTNIQDFFTETSGNASGGSVPFTSNAMLFSYTAGAKATLVNGVFTNMGSSPTFPLTNVLGAGLPLDLPAAITCGGTPYDITFSNLGANAVEYVSANSGGAHGYYRKSDGVCGSWEKGSNDSEKTPGSGISSGSTGSYSISQVGSIACPVPKTANYSATIQFNYPAGNNPYSIEYYIIADNGNGLLEADGVDNYGSPIVLTQAEAINNQITITLPNNGTVFYFIRARSLQGCFFATQRLAVPDCINLPVQFKSFNASRTTSSNVAITWTTAMEQNSKGFNVQKNVGGEWKTIAFVFSQAEGGNSSSDLSYSFKDVNNEKGITQYRIQQVDLDGMAKYSDIKAIRGESAASKIVVYPNPSVDGKLNVVFEDNSGVRDVQVADMQGRIVKSFKGITNNILVIEKLTTGFYTIKVTNRNTAATSVEKVVVK